MQFVVKRGIFSTKRSQGRNVDYQTVDKTVNSSIPIPKDRTSSMRSIRDSSAFFAVIDEDSRSSQKVTFFLMT
jgi:hypothetical protein